MSNIETECWQAAKAGPATYDEIYDAVHAALDGRIAGVGEDAMTRMVEDARRAYARGLQPGHVVSFVTRERVARIGLDPIMRIREMEREFA